jgi:hypothetical protein
MPGVHQKPFLNEEGLLYSQMKRRYYPRHFLDRTGDIGKEFLVEELDGIGGEICRDLGKEHLDKRGKKTVSNSLMRRSWPVMLWIVPEVLNPSDDKGSSSIRTEYNAETRTFSPYAPARDTSFARRSEAKAARSSHLEKILAGEVPRLSALPAKMRLIARGGRSRRNAGATAPTGTIVTTFHYVRLRRCTDGTVLHALLDKCNSQLHLPTQR